MNSPTGTLLKTHNQPVIGSTKWDVKYIMFTVMVKRRRKRLVNKHRKSNSISLYWYLVLYASYTPRYKIDQLKISLGPVCPNVALSAAIVIG